MPDEPSKPRAMPPIPRDRDLRVTKTPPPGVPSLARVPRENWDDGKKTPIGSPDFETLLFRSGVTKDHAIQAVSDIAAVRLEFQSADKALGERMDRIDGKLDVVSGDAREMKGQLGELVSYTRQQQAAQLQTATLTVAAKVEVDKARGLSAVEIEEAQQLDVVHANQWRRKLVIKVLAWSTPLVAAAATVITLLAKKC